MEIQEKLIKWLEEQGYPLEFNVANFLNALRYNVIQSEYYNDPETGTKREIDVVAYKQEVINGVLIRFSFIIECKTSRDKPWILFSTKEKGISEKAMIFQTPSSSFGNYFLEKLTFQENFTNQLFNIDGRTSFGVTQAFTTGKDVTYEAIMNVAKATNDISKEVNHSEKGVICSICFPIVVIEGRLFETFIDNELNIQEKDLGVLLWRNDLVSNPHTIIRICTFDGFIKFIHSLDYDLQQLIYEISPQIIKDILLDFEKTGTSFKLWDK